MPGSYTGSSPICWHSCCSWWQVTLLANCSAISHMSTVLVNIIQFYWFAKISHKNLFGLILSAYLFPTNLTPLTCYKKSASGVGFSPDCFTSKGKKQRICWAAFFCDTIISDNSLRLFFIILYASQSMAMGLLSNNLKNISDQLMIFSYFYFIKHLFTDY